MFKLISSILLITTFFFGGLFSKTLKLNTKLGTEINELEKTLIQKQEKIDTNDKEFRDCVAERSEWREYFGGLHGLEQTRQYYNAPALEEVLETIE